ncbi:MAG: DNA-3-methyladenine glycosylase [Thermoleophilia bacterium]
MPEVVIPTRGPFSLSSAARFLAGFSPLARPDAADDDVLRLAFALDGTGAPAGIALRQDGDGTVHGATFGDADPDAVAAQAARVLSLDVDGTPMEDVAARDPIVATLLERYGALRPVLFSSPFDAGVWAVLTQRTRFDQAIRLRERLRALAPAEVEVDGHALRPFPGPGALVDLEPVQGLPLPKVEWLRELARAAAEGFLDAGRLRALPAEEALRELRELPGVGAFSAELILVRGAGAPDVLPLAEPRVRQAVRVLYGLPGEPSPAEMARASEAWRPLRSWVCLLLRARLAEEPR